MLIWHSSHVVVCADSTAVENVWLIKNVRFHERHWNTGWFMTRFQLLLVGMKLIPKNPINGEIVGWGSFCEFWNGVFWAGQDQDWKMHRLYFFPPKFNRSPMKTDGRKTTYTFLLGSYLYLLQFTLKKNFEHVFFPAQLSNMAYFGVTFHSQPPSLKQTPHLNACAFEDLPR